MATNPNPHSPYADGMPDTSSPEFIEECARQSRLIAASGIEDEDLDFIEKTADFGDWE